MLSAYALSEGGEGLDWESVFDVDYSKNKDFLLSISLLMLVLGVIFQQYWLLALTVLLISYIILNKWYDNVVAKKLKLQNKRQTIRLFPDEEEAMFIVFRNQSFFPYINGRLRFQMPAKIDSPYKDKTSGQLADFELPFSIKGNSNPVVQLPFIANQRGVAKLTNISFVFPHLFNFGKVNLQYKPYLNTEIIIYPRLLPVAGAPLIDQVIYGSHRTRISPFEDVQTIIGTRAYQQSDPFHRINWNASMKTTQLQSNVFEPVIDHSITFIVNLHTSHHQQREGLLHMERLLSYTAFLCHYALEKGFSYELFINARKPGSVPFVHTLAGDGKKHYMHCLEMIARIHSLPMTVPFGEMLYHVGQGRERRNTLIIIGELTEKSHRVIRGWHHFGSVLQLKLFDDGASIQPLERGKTAVATETTNDNESVSLYK